MIGNNKTNVESVKEIKTKECYLLSGRIIELGLKSFISIKGLKNFSVTFGSHLRCHKFTSGKFKYIQNPKGYYSSYELNS